MGSGVLSQLGLSYYYLCFFAIVPLPEHLGQAPVGERGLQKAKRSMVAQKNISRILGIHQAIRQTQG